MKPNPLETLKIYRTTNKNLSLDEIAGDLEQISKIKKCSFCGCNADTLQEFATVSRQNERLDLAAKAEYLRVGIKKRYDCIGCNPCYPADISNLLFEMENGEAATNQASPCGCSSACSSEKPQTWPVEKGEYFVGNPESPVAICTLANTELPHALHAELKERIAIAGYCETENIGIEKIVKNIIANDCIRFLIVCGEESGKDQMGHFAGQAILSLYASGMNEKSRIIGAEGKRPVLKNLTAEQVARFRSQVDIIDLIGENSIENISEAANALLAKNATKFKGREIRATRKDVILARNPQRLVLDKKGFFVILPQKDEGKIYVEYFANNGKLIETIVGDDAPSIYYTLIEKEFISRLDHAAYLGKELTRAEYALKYDIPYVQDKAPGELDENNN